MKKFLLLGILLLAPVSFASADLKVAVVDLSKAFDAYYKTKDAQARIKEKEEGYEKDVQDMKVDYDNMVQEAQKLKDGVNVQDLQNMERKLQETSTERNRELQDEIVRRHKEIVDEITKVVNDYSGPQGFDLVIDKSSSSSTGVPIVLYNSGKLVDITQDVISKLNAGAPPPGTAPAPAPSGAGTPAPAN
jgi:Skp family chaperone for outer membrane proteins